MQCEASSTSCWSVPVLDIWNEGEPWPKRLRYCSASLACLTIASNAALSVTARSARSFSVHGDSGLLQPIDEPAVAEIVLTAGRVNAGNPKRSEDALTVTTVSVGVLTSTHNGLFGNPKDIVTTPTKALPLRQEFFCDVHAR